MRIYVFAGLIEHARLISDFLFGLVKPVQLEERREEFVDDDDGYRERRVHKKFMSAVIYFLRRAGRLLIFQRYIFHGENERDASRQVARANTLEALVLAG